MSPPTTRNLFDENLDPPRSVVEVLARSKPASKAQRQFQQLTGKIELKREQLKQWQAYGLRYNQRVASEIQPLREQLRAGQRQLVLLIDEILSEPKPGRRLGRVQRAKLQQLLMNLLMGLLEDSDDEALTAVHDKYSKISHAELRQSELEVTQSMLEEVFGVEVDADHGATSAEELLQHAQCKMHEHAKAAQQMRDQDQPAAKRSAKAEAAQAKREQAAREVSQSLREVYRKLVSALHPDREPDAEVRQRKTAMMQRVNQAYDANDLLTLLGLQLEIEQIDATHLASVSPQRLTHYNQILREQLADLESELAYCVQPFQHLIGRHWGHSPTPESADQQLSTDIAQLRAANRELQQDLVAFRDPAALSSILKHYRLEDDDEQMDELDEELNELIDMMSSFQHPKSGRGKKRRRS